MEEKNRINKIKLISVKMLVLFIAIFGIGFMTYACGGNSDEILRNVIISFMGNALLVFLLIQAKEFHEYSYDNENYELRFWICYVISFLIAIIVAKLPSFGWPFASIYLVLSLFSNSLIGICASSFLLICTSLISEVGISVFIVYFVCGIITVSLFRHLDEQYKIGIPMISSLIMIFVGVSIDSLLFQERFFECYLLLMPILNVVITFVLNLLILKVFSNLVIYKNQDKYLDINDPEFELLVNLKQKSREEYYRVLHIAYLSDKISKKLNLNNHAVKGAAYYHNIGFLIENNSLDHVMEVCDRFQFPVEVKDIINEFLSEHVISKETAVLYFSDAVVNSILYVIKNSEETKIDYDKVIDVVFDKKKESEKLKNCKMSIWELNQMQNIFKEEKLYYDFLR